MIRVLLVDPSSRGGIGAYTILIAQAVQLAGGECDILGSRALPETESEVLLLRRLPDARWGRPRRAGPLFYADRMLTWLRSASVVTRTVARLQPDVVHFQAQINRRFDARLVRHLARRVPVVWTAHDVLPFERSKGDEQWFSAIYRAADRVIVHTPPAADELIALAGVTPVVISHPVAEGIPRVSRPEARRRLGLPEEGRLLAALGFIRPYKGYSLLADVWQRLGEAAPRLLVMGELLSEEERPVLERLRRCSGADVRVGYASNEEFTLALTAADALLLPHADASDSGLLHMARALGVAVIASDAPQLSAAVAASGAGLTLPRTVEAWSAAVTGQLPPPPPDPPPLVTVGRRHLELYQELHAQRAQASGRTLRLGVYSDACELAGAEQALGSLLAALDPAIEVTILAVEREVLAWLAARRPGSRTLLLPPVRNKWDLRGILAHVRAIGALRLDLLQLNLRHPYSCQYALAAGLLAPGTRVIAVEHLPIPPANRLQGRLRRLLGRRLAAHVSVSRSSARASERVLGIDEGAVRTIYNGMAPPVATPRRLRGRPVVGAAGRLVPEKGFDLYLRALARLPEVSGVLVGDGEERPALERLAAELDLDERLLLTGWRSDARELIAGFDVLVVPSRREPLGLVAVEAMCAGVPVVATRVDGLTEVVDDGECGFLVPPDDVDALVGAIRLALAPGVRERLGARGRELAGERFGAERMASEYERLYREVVAL